MDQKGFLVSMDAILGFVILMVLMGAVVNINNNHQNTYSQDVGFANQAQQTMELMATYHDSSNATMLYQIVNELDSGDNEEKSIKSAGQIAEKFLDRMGCINYKFCEIRQLNGSIIAAKGDITCSKNVNSAVRCCGDYTFQLYVGN